MIINKLVIIIVALSTAPTVFLGAGNRNLLLISIMMIMPFFLFVYRKIEKIDILLILFMICIIILPILYTPEMFRLSTVIYTILFCLLFIAYKQIFYNTKITIDTYISLLKYIIYAYFIVLVIQQVCVLLGFPIFNVSNYNPSEPWKLNSLTSEPSHTARILALLTYSYIIMTEIYTEKKYSLIQDFKKDKYVWVSFLWVMLTSNSGTAFIFLAIVLMKFLQLKNIVLLIILGTISFFLLESFQITALDRTIAFFFAALSFDINTMMSVDHSASLRVAPMIVLFNEIDLTNLQTWFGHGIDSTGNILSKYIYGVQEGFTGGGSLYLIYEYGFISFILFIIYSFMTVVRKNDLVSYIFWVFLIFMYPLNNQIVWLCMTLMFINKWFYKNHKQLERFK